MSSMHTNRNFEHDLMICTLVEIIKPHVEDGYSKTRREEKYNYAMKIIVKSVSSGLCELKEARENKKTSNE